MTDKWTTPTTNIEANRRAGGRAAYNAHRSQMATLRRISVMEGLQRYGTGRGVRARLATELGVHPSTLTRDVQILFRAERRPCPTCGTYVSDSTWKRLRFE